MKLPGGAVVSESKVTRYLLIGQPRSDKSAFLASGGFNLGNYDRLITDLRRLLVETEARQVDDNKFGRYYEIEGVLHGPNGVDLLVKTIWMTEHLSERTKFITLIPVERRHA